MRASLSIIILLITAMFTIASPWTPPSVLEPNHPRIFFTSDDSADIAGRIATSPFSSYYSTVWSRANATSGNSSQAEDFSRSAIAMSAAFVLYFGVQPGGDTLTAAQRTSLQTKALDYLDNMLINIDGTVYDNSNYHYPCERLIQYCAAYDLLQGAGIDADSSRIAALANTIYDGATTWLFGYPVDDISLFMNHKLIVGGALGCAAATLPSQGGEWINYAMTKINKVAFTDESDPTRITGFAEGPHYFKYSMEHLLQFFMGMKHYCGDITEPYIDPCGGDDNADVRTFFYHEGWDSIYYWISAIRLPDGKIPPLDDTFRRNGLCHTAPFAEKDPAFFWGVSGAGSRMFLYPMLIAVGAEPGPELEPGVTCLPDAGNLIFRTGPERGSIYFHILAEHGVANTSTHNQADETSFYINAYGEDIAFDPGYISYSERGRVNASVNHNMILVNGAGTSTLSPVESYLTDPFEIPLLYFGKASTNYAGTDIERNCMLIGERFAVIIDDLRRGSSATYTFQCHGNGLQGDGTFASTPNGGVWTGADSAALKLAVDVVGGLSSMEYETETHETGYNSWADHTVARARKSASNTKFLSVMFPYLQGDPEMTASTASIPNQASIRFEADGMAGIGIARTDPEFFTFDGDTIIPELFGHGEGAVLLFDSPDGEPTVLYTMNCDSLVLDGELLFRTASGAVNLGLHFGDDNLITGFLNSFTATIYLALDYPPIAVTGALSHSWSMGVLTLNLPAKSLFTVEYDPLAIDNNPAPVRPYDLNISAYPNPFNSAVTINIDGAAICHSRAGGYPEGVAVEIYDVAGRRIVPVTELVEVPGGFSVSDVANPEIPSTQTGCKQGSGSDIASLAKRSQGGSFIWTPDASLPSGVYLVRAHFEDAAVTVSRRIVYLK